jgi:hypothetical protein
MSSASTTSRARGWLWLLAGAVALVVAAWATVTVLLPPSRVRALVQAQLSQALAREARFADARVGIFPPVRLTVERPELAEPGGFSKGAAFQARALHLDLDVFALLGRRVVVRRLLVDQPELHLVLRPDGTTNLDGIGRAPAESGKPGGQPMDLELKELRIVKGRMLMDDLKAAKRTTFALDSRISLQSERGGTRLTTAGQTELSGWASGPLSAARLSDLNQALADLTWKIEHDGAFDAQQKRLALRRLAIGFGRAEIALAGVVDDPGPHARLDLKAKGSRVDLGEVLSFFATADAKALAGIRGSGRLDFDLGIRGRMEPGRFPALSGALAVTQGAFRYAGAPAGVEGLTLGARFAPDSLTIPRLTARVIGADGKALAPLEGSVALTHFADPRVAFAVKGPVNLAAVGPLIAPKDTKLSGTAVVALRGRGLAKDPGSLALEGSTRLTGVSVETPQLPKKVEKVEAQIQFSPGRALVRGFTMRAGKSAVALDASVTRPLALMAPVGKVEPAGVDFTLRSPYLDLAELLPVAPGSPVLPNARGRGTVAIERLKNQKLDVSRVHAQLDLSPAVLEVSSYNLDGYGGAVNGSARFDLGNPAKPAFTVKAKVDSVEADDLLSAWTPARGWLHGSLNSDLNLSGAGATPDDIKRTLTALGLALVSNGTLGPGPALEAVASTLGVPAFKEVRFRDLKMPFRVEQGRMITDPVTIEGKSGKWQLTGGIGFDGRLDYAVSVTVPSEVAAALNARSALAAGALSDAQGNLLVDLRVTGPAKAPRVTLDTRAMRDRLAGKISQSLLDQRNKLEQEAQAALEARQQAATDSVRRALDQQRRALEDSLKRRAQDALKGFFGSNKDTSGP